MLFADKPKGGRPQRASQTKVQKAARDKAKKRGVKKNKKQRKKQRRPIPVLALTVDEFCEAHGHMSKVFFYSLLKAGLGPVTMKVAKRRMISIEAAEAWRRQREADTN